jgi:hypothetical protein
VLFGQTLPVRESGCVVRLPRADRSKLFDLLSKIKPYHRLIGLYLAELCVAGSSLLNW